MNPLSELAFKFILPALVLAVGLVMFRFGAEAWVANRPGLTAAGFSIGLLACAAAWCIWKEE